ncbi:hypothetical protein [Lentisalinibacter sediminis]|uniref:hypothetical protein n=1 Tax=Lentisalinibacter sediminis TaxID=2992237 RepID=UPI0038702422
MRRILRPHIFLALAATLLLRAIIPAGFMPAAIGAGFPLQVCPSGLPDGALTRLAGEHAAHHHHGHHGHHDAGDGGNGGNGGHVYSAEQCPIAHLIAAAALPVSAGPAVPVLPAPAIAVPAPRHPATARVHQYRSRGPPVPAAT